MKTKDAMYAAVGAPVVAGRKALELGLRAGALARQGFKESTVEGRKAVERIRKTDVVEDLPQRVGKLKDQVEGALAAWKESFQPEPAPAKKATKKPAAKPKTGSPSEPKAKADTKAKTDTKAKPEKVEVSE